MLRCETNPATGYVPRAALLFASLLLGCSSLIDLEGDASTGEPGPQGTATTTGVPATTGVPTTGLPTTPDSSGAELTSSTDSIPDESSTTDDTVGSQFLIDPDGGSLFKCTLLEQGCARGEKCTVWANDGGNAWNATRCVPIDVAPDGPGEPCTVEGAPVSGFDSCDGSSMCWGVDAQTLEGTCTPFCTSSADGPLCEDPGLTCESDGLLFLCLSVCDPLAQDCPTEGDACYVLDNTAACAADSSGAAGLFDACAFVNGCDPGLTCAAVTAVGLCDDGAESCCTPFCDLDAPTCPKGTQCNPAFDAGAVPPGYENVGICGQDPG